MSRWSKSRPHSVTVPIESLIKEKENNSDRITALRSAGTIGRWGITSFTSIRNTNYGPIGSLSPTNQLDNNDYTHGNNDLVLEKSGVVGADVPKPKKFFKSRNRAPEPVMIQPQNQLDRSNSGLASPNHFNSNLQSNNIDIAGQQAQYNNQLHAGNDQESPANNSIVLNTTAVTKTPRAKKEKAPKPPKKEKVPKPPKKEKVETKSPKVKENVICRNSSRNRNKVVNYNEDRSRSPTPKRSIFISTEAVAPIATPAPASVPAPTTVALPEMSPTCSKYINSPAAKTPLNSEHPPIVLRISKGTARLISTDSEDIINSPSHVNSNPNDFDISTANQLSSTAELLAVLGAESPKFSTSVPETPVIAPVIIQPQQQLAAVQNNVEPEKLEKRTSCLKIKIKTEAIRAYTEAQAAAELAAATAAAAAAAAAASEAAELERNRKASKKLSKVRNEPAPVVRKTRSKKNASTIETSPIEKLPNDNYELYKTLASPSDKDFDSQSSILGSSGTRSSKSTPNQSAVILPIEDSRVVHSRGSSVVTTDFEASQQSSLLAAPPSEINDTYSDPELLAILESPPQEHAAAAEEINQSYADPELLRILESPPTETSVTATIKGKPKRNPRKTAVMKPQIEEIVIPEVNPSGRTTRSTRSSAAVNINNNEIDITKSQITPAPITTAKPAALKSYSRKRKNNQELDMTTDTVDATVPDIPNKISSNTSTNINLPSSNNIFDDNTNINNLNNNNISSLSVVEPNVERKVFINENIETNNMKFNTDKEYKLKNKFKKSWYEHNNQNLNKNSANSENSVDNQNMNIEKMIIKSNNDNTSVIRMDNEIDYGGGGAVLSGGGDGGPGLDDEMNNEDNNKSSPSVKLVISKKKGSIFKSRPIVADNKKRHVYKHKWDDNDSTKDKKDKNDNPDYDGDFTDEDDGSNETIAKKKTSNNFYDEDFEGESSGLSRVNKTKNDYDDFGDEVTSVRCDRKTKPFYTVVRNVKKAHQIQEIGEFQEMDDDVEYILSALQPDNPSSTRCLSAMQLATKCMTPAFRMHVRAHGTATKFFRALRDATKDQNLGLCTALVMFVLSQDELNMDLDRDSLELMLNLLESDVSHKSVQNTSGLTKQQLEKNKIKVRELCEEIKTHGKATHLNLDKITIGTLAMETLLSLTSKRAGEWFKEELRELGGIEHIIKTICDCCNQVTDTVVEWTEHLLNKVRKIERCLRVLENVTQMNEQNQTYILNYKDSIAITTLVKFYKLCDSEISLNPTNSATPKDSPGVVIREAIVPTLKVLISLTHPFNDKALGSVIIGGEPDIFDTSLHLLLQLPNYVPEECIFDLNILVLLLLINLTTHTLSNRKIIMDANAPSDFGNVLLKVPATKSLVEYFYKCKEMAALAEQNTDAILDNPNKDAGRTHQSAEEVDATVNKLLQKAGHHMEHTMLASYICLLVGYLMTGNEENQSTIRKFLPDGTFSNMVDILDKYYNFMNLTASSEPVVVAHIKATKDMIEFLKQCDAHSNSSPSRTTGSTNSRNSYY